MKFRDEAGRLITPITLQIRSDLDKDGSVTVRKVIGEILIWNNEGNAPNVTMTPVVAGMTVDKKGYAALPEELRESIENTMKLMTEYTCMVRKISVKEE